MPTRVRQTLRAMAPIFQSGVIFMFYYFPKVPNRSKIVSSDSSPPLFIVETTLSFVDDHKMIRKWQPTKIIHPMTVRHLRLLISYMTDSIAEMRNFGYQQLQRIIIQHSCKIYDFVQPFIFIRKFTFSILCFRSLNKTNACVKKQWQGRRVKHGIYNFRDR